eukprot:Lithocolla_globosa_v1_NODE_2325_length_2047_cov_13.879518.p1 type:complete len:515 gc:universal NODE_2325_length_2047_cov_13.879518:1838-294(-)
MEEDDRLLSDNDSETEREQDAPTPLPLKQVMALYLVVINEAFQLSILFPFVYFMVKSFDVAETEEKIGFYVGIIASSFALSQVVSSIPLGWASDRIGRRPVILFGLLGSSVSIIMFGLSTSLWWAILSRCLCGLLNGNVGIAKSSLGEITDKTNQAKAFAGVGLCFGVGIVVGPLVGGFLADPYNVNDGEGSQPETSRILEKFPYLLPCLTSGAFAMFSFVVAFIFMKETVRHDIKVFPNVIKVDKHDEEVVEEVAQLIGEQQVETPPHEKVRIEDQEPEEPVSKSTTMIKLTMGDLLRNASIWFAILSLAMISLITIVIDEVFPLWAVLEPPIGLGFNSDDIGIVIAYGGGVLFLNQIFVYPAMQKRFGIRRLYAGTILFLCPTLIAMPFTAELAGKGKETSDVWLWVGILLITTFRFFFASFAFTAATVAINNSVFPINLGLMNGLGQTTASVSRAIGPFAAGTLWSFSLITGLPFPLDHHLVFVLAGCLALLGSYLGYMLPYDIDFPKKNI